MHKIITTEGQKETIVTTLGTDNTTVPTSKAVRDTIEIISINNQVDSYQLVLTDVNKLVEINHVAAKTLTVPLNATIAFPIGTQVAIVQQGAGQVTIAPEASVILRSPSGLNLVTQYSSAVLTKRAADEWYVSGDLTL